jgi:predicted MPP superfamily phosphohydrolase
MRNHFPSAHNKTSEFIFRMQYISDIHLEMHKPKTGRSLAASIIAARPVGVFCLLLAGDIGYGEGRTNFLAALQACTAYRHVVYVLGNHEFYTRSRDKAGVWKCARKLEEQFPKLRVLENQMLTGADIPELGEHRLLGTTLWSPITDAAAAQLNDFVHIKTSGHLRMVPREYRALHDKAVAWLTANIKEGDIVLTHHLPSEVLVDTARHGTELISAYAGHLDALVRDARPSHWVFGHSHNAGDFTLGVTRMHTNCLGYASERTGSSLGAHFSLP